MDIPEHRGGGASPAGEAAPSPERGQRVFLDGPPDGPWCSTVTGRTGDLVALTAPASRALAAAPPAGSRLRIGYVLGDVPFEAEAEIVEAPTAGSGGCTARLTGAPRRVQRRGAVRVPARLIATASVSEADGEGAAIAAVTDNLSAGGALLRTPSALDPGTTVRLVIVGAAAGTLELAGRCVRCDRVADGARPWRVAVTFQDVDPATADRLARLVLDPQGERPTPTRT